MTTPTVTELTCRREPISADTFLGELALAEQRLYGDTQPALIALGIQPVALSWRDSLGLNALAAR